ncbi:MAG TPA: sigma-70 family RNA polymerase sigma factor [Candidatus Acidoferrum sp.]|nr:sigma-70 family RNA polymerase sigma factor [Candidatus Acidoferrum sp.]
MTRPVPDEELMLMVRDGSAEMLGVLFDRYQTPLYSFYTRLTGNRAASEDLVQDVFLRILKYRRSYRPGTPFRPWMYQIARNARVDHAGRQMPHAELNEAAAATGAAPQSPDDQHELLHRALRELTDEKREILLLSRFQGLRCEEMAQIYGCRVGAMKVRVHRALEELRAAFLRLERGGAEPGRKTAGANDEL